MGSAGTTQVELRVRPYEAVDQIVFRRLNEEWITAFFRMESKDEEMFADPQRMVLDKGGHIFLAERTAADKWEAVGCCALLSRGGGAFELSKMAVAPSCRGLGIGRKILDHIIYHARLIGASRLYIETSHKLPNAIHLYESVGFTHLPPERIQPSPYERADVYMEMLLNQ